MTNSEAGSDVQRRGGAVPMTDTRGPTSETREYMNRRQTLGAGARKYIIMALNRKCQVSIQEPTQANV